MQQNEVALSDLKLISPVFREGSYIPSQYTCKGQDVSVPLNILDAPLGTQSLTLIMHDPDSVSGDFLHWLVWDIPPSTESIAANSLPVGAIQGLNDNDELGYMGPCPPAGSGTHRYMLELYALDTTLDLPAESSRKKVVEAMKGHILGQTTLTGLFGT